LKELKSLTQYFFAEFEEEDNKRVCEEESLKEKEIRVIYLLCNLSYKIGGRGSKKKAK